MTFVGRAEALGALEGALSAATRVVLVEGPPGVGKTALIARFLEAHAELPVLRASGERGERDVALGVADQLLRRAGRPGEGEAGERMLEALAKGGARIVIVDDAQWADPASLGGVGLRVAAVEDPFALVVIARRPAGWPRRLRGLAGCRIDLGPLGPTTCDSLALAASPGRPCTAVDARRRRPALAWRSCARCRRTRGSTTSACCRLRASSRPTWRSGWRAARRRRWVEAAAVLGGGVGSPMRPRSSSVDAVAGAGNGRGGRAGRGRLSDGVPASSSRRRRSPPRSTRSSVRRGGRSCTSPRRRGRGRGRRVAAPGRGRRRAGRDARRAAGRVRAPSRERPEAATALIAASRLSPTREQREDRLLRAADLMLLAGDAARARGPPRRSRPARRPPGARACSASSTSPGITSARPRRGCATRGSVLAEHEPSWRRRSPIATRSWPSSTCAMRRSRSGRAGRWNSRPDIRSRPSGTRRSR